MRAEIVTVAGQRYSLASWRRRAGAAVLDIAFLAGLISLDAVAGEWLLALTIPCALFYAFFGNALLQGATIGKRLMGIKVIDARHGSPCTYMQDFVRHRYLFLGSFLFLVLSAFDSAQGAFSRPEVYLVRTVPPLPSDESPPEKPAKLDLAGMKASLQKGLSKGVEDESR
jgi:hypothetical protein